MFGQSEGAAELTLLPFLLRFLVMLGDLVLYFLLDSLHEKVVRGVHLVHVHECFTVLKACQLPDRLLRRRELFNAILLVEQQGFTELY